MCCLLGSKKYVVLIDFTLFYKVIIVVKFLIHPLTPLHAQLKKKVVYPLTAFPLHAQLVILIKASPIFYMTNLFIKVRLMSKVLPPTPVIKLKV